jgi:transposase-like protein
MEIDPMGSAEAADESAGTSTAEAHAASARLNTWVAITVALLATFMGVCKVKDDNIVQAMQQAQADKIDHWSFYQARNIRQEIAQAELTELTIARGTESNAAKKVQLDSAVARYKALVTDQATKKDSLRVQAQNDQTTYDSLNYHDDQFDLSDTLIALAISLLALTSLTKKRWLYWIAMVPTGLGVLMGLAGLFGLHIHSDAISRLLS